MRTGAGSAVGVSEDEEGRVFFFDRAGNLYYDTGDKRLGFYIVSTDPPRSPLTPDQSVGKSQEQMTLTCSIYLPERMIPEVASRV